MKYYAVASGRRTGVFTSWPEAKAQVHGYPRAAFKSFATLAEAQDFVARAGNGGGGGGADSGRNR